MERLKVKIEKKPNIFNTLGLGIFGILFLFLVFFVVLNYFNVISLSNAAVIANNALIDIHPRVSARVIVPCE